MTPRKTYSVIIVPSDHTKTRQFQVSRIFLVSSAAVLGLLLVTMIVFAVTYASVLSEARTAQQLRIENQRLADQVGRVNDLSRELEEIAGLRAQLFNMLGAIDEDGSSSSRPRSLDIEPGDSVLEDAERLQLLFAEESRKPFAPRSWPLEGRVRREFSAVAEGSTPPHPGISIEARPDDEVRSAGAGRIVGVGAEPPGGSEPGVQLVEIDHGYGFRTIYRGLARTEVVPGQAVTQGQTIGWMRPVVSETGNPGSRIGSAVLYFEIRVDGTPVNPRSYLALR